MAKAGVDGAVLIPLGPEDRYVSTCVASDPARFAGIAVSASDEEDPGRVAERLDVGRFSGLRMFGLPGDLIDRPTWLGVLERLAAAGKVLWLYPQPEHLPAADAVAAAPARPSDRAEPHGLHPGWDRTRPVRTAAD